MFVDAMHPLAAPPPHHPNPLLIVRVYDHSLLKDNAFQVNLVDLLREKTGMILRPVNLYIYSFALSYRCFLNGQIV